MTDSLLYRLSVYGVPIVAVVVTLVAAFAWEDQYPAGNQLPLEIRVIEDRLGNLTPARALERLAGASPVRYSDTHLSESRFWFSFVVRPPEDAGEVSIELPSRHAVEMTCWEKSHNKLLGQANRAATSGRLRADKAGFAIELGRVDSPTRILCSSVSSGPARISVAQWRAADLHASASEFHRNSGLLEGGLAILSAFALLTAIVTREKLYMLFAAWLFAGLRLGAISAGWDTQWFEWQVPPEWIFQSRKLTIALYVVLTYALFRRLFLNDLKRIDGDGLLRINQWLALGLLVAAPFVSFSRFLPLMWLVTGIGVAIFVYLLGRIIWATRSMVAVWYGASFVIVLSTGLYEVIAAALGIKVLIGLVNSVTGALPASLATALAIAEQIRQERESRLKAQEELKDTYEAMPIGLFTLSGEGQFNRVNPAMKAMLGEDFSARQSARWADFFGAPAWTRMLEGLRGATTCEMELRGPDGEAARWFAVKATMTGGKIEGSLQDITERHDATERLRYLAENDALTGALNRTGVEHALQAAYARLASGGTFSLAYLDLDRFKLINDLFGHVAGDEVLRQVCARARSMLGEPHRIGRVGGDEFVILFQDTTMKVATAICRGIIDVIGRNTYNIKEKAFQVKASIGLVEVAAGTPLTDALAMADRACRDAKEGHHDGLTVYAWNAPAFTKRKRELRILERVGSGAAPQGVYLLMQPIMSLRAPTESLSFEVLLRMRDADGAIIPAGDVVTAAEKNGAVALLDRWVLQNTLEWIGTNRARLANTRFASVNLSGGSLNDEKFVQDAFALFARNSYAAERLCVEITEGVALHDLENTRRFIHRARDFGVKVALDDFGAGYTSFSYLKELPADALKIDGSFVMGLNTHPANLSIIQTIVELAANLGMRSIAEWVEDRASIEALARVGVDYVQGFVVATPQEPEKILAAESAADFIRDEGVARYVRDLVAQDHTAVAWDRIDELVKTSRHDLH